MKVLAVGDVCGKAGMEHLRRTLRVVQRTYGVDFTVVNGENANVVGVTPDQCEELLNAGADVITLGNHTWVRWEMRDYLEDTPRVLRPLNFAARCPGRGEGVFETSFGPVRVLNAMGRYGLDANTDNPFPILDRLLSDRGVTISLLDFHAEATSEKIAMGYLLEGRASAVWGTHTHVQTSDCCVLPGGTGYITDLGMTGPIRSVLGIDPRQSIDRFLGEPPRRYRPGEGPCKMECALFTIDPETGRCLRAEALRVE